MITAAGRRDANSLTIEPLTTGTPTFWNPIRDVRSHCEMEQVASSLPLTSRDVPDETEHGVTLAMQVHRSADHDIEEDHEDSAKSRQKEKNLSTVRHLPSPEVAGPTDQVQHEQGREAERSVDRGCGKILESVDNGLVGRPIGVEVGRFSEHL